MSDDFSVRHIEKLDGSNFLTWKFEMKAVFRAAKVHSIVDGSDVLAAEATAAEKNAWEEKDAKARVLISTSIERSQLISLITCETAKEMWDALCGQYEQTSSSSKLHLLNKFHAYQMGPGDTVVQHVAKIKNMALQLKNVGAVVPDDTVMAKILSGLPPSYNGFQTAWDNIDSANQTIQSLTERLVREETRHGTSGDAVEVLAAVKSSGTRKKTLSSKTKKDLKDVKCFKCHEKGHFARECPQKTSGGGKDKGASRKFVLMANVKNSGSTSPKTRVGISDEQVRRLLEVDKAETWIGDSGASCHLTYRREWFKNFRSCVGGSVVLGNGTECNVAGEGDIELEAFVDGRWNSVRIEKVLYVPEMKKNLLALGACAKKGCFIGIDENSVTVTLEDEIVMTGVSLGNAIYQMLVRVVLPTELREVNVSTADLKVWHERLGHVGARALEDMIKNDRVTGVKLKNAGKFFCEPCQLGKAHRKSFNESSRSRELKPGECVHTDVCGPLQVKSQGGAIYFVTFIDEASSFCHVDFLRHKDEVIEKFEAYDKMVENKFGAKLKIVRSDNGGEYKNKRFATYLKKRGIIMENSAPYTPEQNGKAERANRTIFESARTMLRAKNLPKALWAEAVNTAVYILNRTTHSSRGNIKTAYEEWTGRKPALGHVRIFGSVAYAHIPKQFRKKLDDKAKKLVLVGYQDESSNYRLYDLKKKSIVVSRDVVFDESGTDESTSMGKSEGESLKFSGENEVVDLSDESDVEAEPDEQEEGQRDEQRDEPDEAQRNEEEQAENREEPVGRQLRNRRLIRPPDRYLYEIDFVECKAPATFREAVSGPDGAKWSEAINQELLAHEENGTWTVVDKKPSDKLIDSKWVFKVIEGSTTGECRYKARLCARGFLQREGVDYNETFAPVVRYDSLRAFLAKTTQEDYELAQFDVYTAFLYGELEEDIFMKIPEGLIIEGSAGVRVDCVCKLNKSLYGLKQAPRCWNFKFSEFLKKFSFSQGNADHCLFKGCVESENVFLALFVDDGLVAAKSNRVISVVLDHLKSAFKITIGDASRFVGLQIKRDRAEKSMFVHQSEYAGKVLEKFGMLNAKSLCVPADPNVTLYPVEHDDECEDVPYREAVGSLMFLAVVSRPDIMFAVNLVSKFLSKHSRAHWMAVKRIFAYLVGTRGRGILYKSGGNESELVGYCDADFAGDVETRRSTTGYAFMFANGPVSWSSQRQKNVTLSTTESEYVAATAAAREAVWLRKLFEELGSGSDKPTVIWVDNQSAIKLAKNPEYHKRTKHIDIKVHYVREKVASQDIELKYISTECQRADIFTKALPRKQFQLLCDLLAITSSQTVSVLSK